MGELRGEERVANQWLSGIAEFRDSGVLPMPK